MSRPRLRVALTLLLLLVSTAASAARADEVEPGIHRLDGLDESLPHDDLEPLARIVGQADVVGLGEAVHTVGGFYRAKFRIFKYLVEELGFRVMAFESPWIAADRVAEYVQSCRGSARTAIQGLFGVWQSHSVRDLVNWMCRWNQNHPDDPVHFYGFDIQQGGDLLRLRLKLLAFGMDVSDAVLDGLSGCLRNRTTAGHEGCLLALDGAEAYLDRNAAEIVASTSAEELAWARIHIAVIRSYENALWFRDRDFATAIEARDAGMAYVLEHIRKIRFPDARTAVWAHNFHLARGKVGRIETMGFYLKKAFKRKYKAIGLVAFEASTDWSVTGCGLYATAAPGSVEDLLRQLGEPLLLVDLAFPGGDPPFLRPGREYEINWGWRLTPRRRFAGLVYLESAEKMRPLAWPACTP